MKKFLFAIIISFSLFFLSACVSFVDVSDIELILIDEGFSIIEYQESQKNRMNLTLSDYCECEVSRVIEGRLNQITEVYVFEFEKRSQAVDFVKIIENDEFIEVISFKLFVRYGNIVVLAGSLEIIELFEGM
ncbi:MAG: hypothetical protein CVV57_04310 [Tenericutes bacterium HGW-Tenericutes-2]|jgi:hypothetical protein|nr:MAG: hypothetical protein CVV57_04310 [Tenericutes bacterium HGW-Tenericutes-2]